jgi:hypothetical protein
MLFEHAHFLIGSSVAIGTYALRQRRGEWAALRPKES